jgi:hypothetical protein
MFVICIYLITIEYIDDTLQKTLEEVTDREANFDELIADTGKLEEMISGRRERILEIIRANRAQRSGGPESEDEK